MQIKHYLPQQGARYLLTGTLLLCFLLLEGCGSSKSYDDAELRTAQSVIEGTIINTSDIQVTERPGLERAMTDAAIGGAIGSIVKPGHIANALHGGAGAVLGATTGYLLSEGSVHPKTYKATELTVELDNGSILLIVLENKEYFIRGDRVRIISLKDQYVRVQHK